MVGAAPTLDRRRRTGAHRAATAVTPLLALILLVLAGSAAAGASSGTPADTTPPSTPTGLTIPATTQTSITMVWSASTDNVGVRGYRLFRNGTQVAAVATKIFTFSGLACGSSYTLGVAAIDALQNQSQPAAVSGATRACGTTASPAPPAPTATTPAPSPSSTTPSASTNVSPDTTAPSVPGHLAALAVKQTSVGLSWSASSDNVGVTGYRVYRGGSQAGSTAATSYTVTGLACATGYTLGVAAVDAAGNVSGQATVSVTTSACGSIPPAGATAPSSGSLAVAPAGSDTNPCTPSAPCATFDRAYHVASPGETVQVAAGSYGPQSITPDATKTGADVVFTAAGTVTVAKLAIGGSHLTFQNMSAVWKMLPTATAVTLRNISSPGAIYITGGASNISVLGGQIYSPVPVASDSQIASLYGKVPTNILFDGVSFHDFRDIGPGNLHHIECLQVGAAINLTIQNSTFTNCETHDLFIRSWGNANNSPSPLSNILIQNNSFAKTYTGYYAMQVLDDLWTGQPPTSVTITNNHFLQDINVVVTHGTASITNNYLPTMSAYMCQTLNSRNTTTSLSGNTYGTGVPCGTNSTVLNTTTPPPTAGSIGSSTTSTGSSATSSQTTPPALTGGH